MSCHSRNSKFYLSVKTATVNCNCKKCNNQYLEAAIKISISICQLPTQISPYFQKGLLTSAQKLSRQDFSLIIKTVFFKIVQIISTLHFPHNLVGFLVFISSFIPCQLIHCTENKILMFTCLHASWLVECCCHSRSVSLCHTTKWAFLLEIGWKKIRLITCLI